MQFWFSPPHVSPASLERDHIDVLFPFVGPLYISMRVWVCVWMLYLSMYASCVTVQQNLERMSLNVLSRQIKSRTLHHVCQCVSVCASVCVCLSLVCVVVRLLVVLHFVGVFQRCRKQLDQPCYCNCLPP